MTQDLKKYVNAWVQKAENDLLTAQRLIEIDPIILDNACFNCQQAMEKFLKAFLAFRSRDIKKTHNVDFLLEECSMLDNDFKGIDVKNIEDYAVKGRYPDDSIMPAIEEAKEYFQIAHEIKELVLKKIKL